MKTETKPTALHVTSERAMDLLWRRSHTLTEGLVTRGGERLRVVYPGTANHRSGPDFRGAVIATESGERIMGDVELHLNEPDWYRHGHHEDANYNGVVLHVVLSPRGRTATSQRSGTETPVASIAGLGEELSRGRKGPEYVLPGVESGDADSLKEALGQAGDERFSARRRGFEMALRSGDPDQTLYGALMESLGYASNRRPFLELARRVPFASLVALRDEPPSTRSLAIRSVLTVNSGLLSCVEPPEEAEELRRIERAFRRCGRRTWGQAGPYRGKPVFRERWDLFRLRPSNHPLRRIAGAAALVDRLLDSGPVRALEPAVREDTPRSLAKRLQVTGAVGAGRASDMVVNVPLPFFSAYAALRDSDELYERCRELYDVHPKLADNEATREMKRLLGPDASGAVTGARAQQGLIHLYKALISARSA